MSPLGFLLVPMVLAAASELTIDNYKFLIDNNTLKSIERVHDGSSTLNLSGLGLEAIDNKNVFDNLDQVKILDLSRNSLSVLPEFVFSNLTNLESLSLADNAIEAFENAFVGLHNLKTLNISNNPMKHLRKSFFFGLTKSTDIVTRGDRFWTISTELFENPFLRAEPLPAVLAKEAAVPGTGDKVTEVERTRRETPLEDAPVLNKDLRVKICLKDGTVSSLEVMTKDESLATDCKEVQIDSAMASLSLSKLGIKSFEKGWYRLEGLPAHTLQIKGNDIAQITAELLNDLPASVESVNLADNKIERLDRGVINNERLRTLNLNGNFIGAIDDGAFEKTKLRALYLSDNRLTDTRFAATLPSTLTQILLAKNALTEISAGSFAGLNGLLYLNAQENNITELQAESLRGLTALQSIDLRSSHLQRIQPGSFQDLQSLQVLHLIDNDIASLEKGVFTGLTSVERIYMGNNKLSKIGKEALHGFPDSLLELGLNANRLESLEAGTFVNAPTQLLYLNDNRISRIERGAFDLPNLNRLKLEGNSLKKLDGDAFEGLGQLRHLAVNANGIANIEKGAAKNLGSLYSLDISDNPIRRLENGALFGLQKSRGAHVQLTTVPVELIQGGLFDDV